MNYKVFHKFFEVKSKKGDEKDDRVSLFYLDADDQQKRGIMKNFIIDTEKLIVVPKPRIWVCCSVEGKYDYTDYVSVLFYSSSFWIVYGSCFDYNYLIFRVGYRAYGRSDISRFLEEFVKRLNKRALLCLVAAFEHIQQNFSEMYEKVGFVHDYVMCSLIASGVGKVE